MTPRDPSATLRDVALSSRTTDRETPAPHEITPDPDAFTWRGWAWGFVQRMFVMLSLYVLSIGPMYWQWYGGRFAGGSRMVAAFYEPIFVVATLCPPFGKWMDWYVGLWIG